MASDAIYEKGTRGRMVSCEREELWYDGRMNTGNLQSSIFPSPLVDS